MKNYSDEIQPGDVRQDALIPTRRLFIVKLYRKDDDGHTWWECNLGVIGTPRIGKLLYKERVEDWDWVD